MDFCFVMLHFDTPLAVNAQGCMNSNSSPFLLPSYRIPLQKIRFGMRCPMAKQNNTNNDTLKLYRPASEPATLLFLALPYLVPSVRPLAELCFHLLELHHLLKRKEIADFSSLFSGSLIADKDGLLSSLKNGCDAKYRPMFELLANLSQVMQFYQMYQEMMPLLQSLGVGSNMEDTTNLAGLFGANNPLASMFSSNFSNIMNAASVSDSPNESLHTYTDAAPTNTNNASDQTTTFTNFSASQDSKSCLNASDDIVNEDTTSDGFSASYDDLLALLSPEQKELFEQLQGIL